MTRSYPDGRGYGSIFERDEPMRFVGWVLLIPEDKGVASEAARVAIGHAFGTLGLQSIVRS